MSQCIHCGVQIPAPSTQFCPACGRPQHAGAQAAPEGYAPLQGYPQHGQRAPAAYAHSGGHAPTSSAAPRTATVMGNIALPGGDAPVMLQIQDGQNLTVAPLGNVPMTLGRRPDNNIVLASLWVSGYHARIEPVGDAHKIVDVGSRNGIYFNGRRVQEQVLQDGDILRIPDPTTANFVTIRYVNQLSKRVEQSAKVAMHFPTPPGRPVVTIGRVQSDIVLNNPQVSSRHAQLEWKGGYHVLRDLRSTNGTWLNGQRVRDALRIKPGDVIQIGPFKLIYDGDSLDSYDQRGAMRIDARGLRREVDDRSGPGKKVILHDVSLSIDPREFVALVGGSGTGKSTLMMALSGFVRADHGSVLVNGDDYYRNFDAYRAVLGYVPQDDILHRMLPVDRALQYAARLKLPADISDEEIDTRVEEVLAAVEMTAHRDKLVDNLSGGQRKRVSIAAELLSDPSLMFLDEPTSGLDPGLEKKMMYTLRQLADSGRTVVLVTHATANITQCDHVCFMSTGRMVFFGPPREALAFFQVTSGDFADIYTKLEGKADPNSQLIKGDLSNEYAEWKRNNPDAKEEPYLAELWEMRYKRSPQYQYYVVNRLARAPSGPTFEQQQAAQRRSAQLKYSPWRQFAILAKRYVDLTVQDRKNLGIMLAQAPIIGLLLTLVSKNNSIAGAGATTNEAKKLLFMLSTVGVWFGIINAAREICKETPVFRRERLANLRVAPYVWSKVVVLFLLVLVQSGLLMAVLNLRVAFPEEALVFSAPGEFFVTTALAGGAGLAMGLLISALASTPDKAISIVPLALIPQILFAGLIFKLESVTNVISWLTASRWSMDAFGSIADLNHLPMYSRGPTAEQAHQIEEQYSNTAAHVLACWTILVAYAGACIALTSYVLDKRKY